ncbi:Uu.00g122790.m01.CDS01 [Anthostomella pinea]|uniref:Uu.00g122790.m01.CDS01 n=1 Tax=Anthostomella pinea TaxID=933095 RepID=A0AAI8VI82_9PEZI|nr:Uu.00g122790.m01.CDS01 [Anthostomella pinea]
MSSTAAVFGNTGLVGSHILETLLGLDACKSVYTISRRAPKTESPKLNATIEADTTKWTSKLHSIAPLPETVFSALGTTRVQAGGIQNQWKIDHDLNIEIAKAAHAAGVKTYIFISSGGTRGLLSNYVPYSKMKVGVEDAIKSLGFEQAIIVRPGMLLGDRGNAASSHPGNGFLNSAFRSLGYIGQGVQNKFSQEGDVVARAAVKASILAAEGKASSKYWILDAAEIVKLGRDEWKS